MLHRSPVQDLDINRTYPKMALPPLKRRKVCNSAQDRAIDEDDMFDDGSSESSLASPGRDEAVEGKFEPQASNGCRTIARYTKTTSANDGGMHSSLLQLQLDELLSTVRPDYEGRMRKVENALRKLKAVIERIPPRGARPVRCIGRSKSKYLLMFHSVAGVKGFA